MSVISNNQLAGASGQGGSSSYEISRSLRFNSGDSSHLVRTPSSAGNRTTWSWSGWIKRSKLGVSQFLFNATDHSSTTTVAYFKADDTLEFYDYQSAAYTTQLVTSQVFRDVSSWFHLVIAWDTTQATASDRVKIYINGSQVSAFGTSTYPSQNTQSRWNNNVIHDIGQDNNNNFLDGYLAEVHFIDGQALTATDFGEYDSNNVWQPKEFTGSHGTNGFHLDFSDTSDLGNDAAGSNNWTPNNLVGAAPGLSTANQGMDVVTYTGNGSTQSITGLNFQPDFVWLKKRSGAADHYLYDVVRGANNRLYSNTADAESTSSTGLTAFTSDGFTVGSANDVNQSSNTYVAWCWKAGGTASSNSDGSITSSVSANSTYGFSVVTYTGTGSNATVGHGLSSAPKWIVVKNRDQASGWSVYHDAIGTSTNNYVELQSNAEAAQDNTAFQNTAPTNSVFSIGTKAAVNSSGYDFVAYCWSEVSGFSKFGSYTGNGSTTGPIVTTGFKPRFLLIKADIAGEDWVIMDTSRDSGNPVDQALFANTADAEITNSAYNTEFQVDGFQLKNTNPRFNTSGATYIYAAFASKPSGEVIDSLIDTPTNYTAGSGNNGGNYCTLNPLDNATTLSNGNLTITGSSSSFKGVRSTIGMSSGKWYMECKVTAYSSSTSSAPGIWNGDDTSLNTGGGSYGNAYLFVTDYASNYRIYVNKGSSNPYSEAGSISAGDIIGIALDLDNGKCYVHINGTYLNSGNSVYNTWPADTYFFGGYEYTSGNQLDFNFGQRPFAYTPPSNHLALCTQNLPDPAIADGSTVFDTKLYTGTGSTQSITGLNFSPDFVWIKNRNAAGSHDLYDIVRGADTVMNSDATFGDYSGSGRLTSFNSDGFTLGSQSAVNINGGPFVSWNWDAGTSTATNNDGSITSSVRANPSAGFSIVAFDTGSSSSNETVGHGLNATPELVIVKDRDATDHWYTWSNTFSNSTGHYLRLDGTHAVATSAGVWGAGMTSSVIGLAANQIGGNNIAYCFTPVAGYSAFGSYTGNGSSDGPFVYTGHRSRFILIKRTDSAADWVIYDTARGTYNPNPNRLYPNLTDAETSASTSNLAVLSNGFQPLTNNGTFNTSGATYVYASFAEHPFKTSRAS